MNHKTITSFLILQLLAFPCMATGDDEQEENLSVQVQAEEREEINNVNHSIFSHDEERITFTLRELYTAARSEDARAKKLVEYLGEMFGHAIKTLYIVEDENFSFEGEENLDHRYTLPEHFTQKMLDEPLWGIDIVETGLDKLFPRIIEAGATYEAIQALEQSMGIEPHKPYFNEQDGQTLLAEMVMNAAKILAEQNTKIQTFEAEKTEFEKMIPQMESVINEIKAKFEQTQNENLSLIETLKEKENLLQDTLQKVTDISTTKEKLEAKLADAESKHSLLQGEHDKALSDLNAIKNELERSTHKNLTYEEMIKQALSALTAQQITQ